METDDIVGNSRRPLQRQQYGNIGDDRRLFEPTLPNDEDDSQSPLEQIRAMVFRWIYDDLSSSAKRTTATIRSRLTHVVFLIRLEYGESDDDDDDKSSGGGYADLDTAINIMRRLVMPYDEETLHPIVVSGIDKDGDEIDPHIMDVIIILYLLLNEAETCLGPSATSIRSKLIEANGTAITNPHNQAAFRRTLHFLWHLDEIRPLMQFMSVTNVDIFTHNPFIRVVSRQITTTNLYLTAAFEPSRHSFLNVYVDPRIGGVEEEYFGIDAIYESLASVIQGSAMLANKLVSLSYWVPLYLLYDSVHHPELLLAMNFEHTRIVKPKLPTRLVLHDVVSSLYNQMPRLLLNRVVDGFMDVPLAWEWDRDAERYDRPLDRNGIELFVLTRIDDGLIGPPSIIYPKLFAEIDACGEEMVLPTHLMIYAAGLLSESTAVERRKENVFSIGLEHAIRHYGPVRKHSAGIVGLLYSFGQYNAIKYAKRSYGLDDSEMVMYNVHEHGQTRKTFDVAKHSEDDSPQHLSFGRGFLRQRVTPPTLAEVAEWENASLRDLVLKYFRSTSSSR